MQKTQDNGPLKTHRLALKVNSDQKMYASPKRYGRHLAAKSVNEREFASMRQDIDDSQKIAMQKLKQEKIKLWEELRRIQVRSRSLKQRAVVKTEVQTDRRTLEKKWSESERPTDVAIQKYLAGSLTIKGVRPKPRPTQLGEDGRPRPKTTDSRRALLTARQIEELRPKTASAFLPSFCYVREPTEVTLPPGLSRKLQKADRLTDSLDSLQIRHYLTPEEMATRQRNRTTAFQPLSARRHRVPAYRCPSWVANQEDLKGSADSLSLYTDSVQTKRLLGREKCANNLRRKSLSMDDVSSLGQFKESLESNDDGKESNRSMVRSASASASQRLATKGLITKPLENKTVIKLPSAEPEEDPDEDS